MPSPDVWCPNCQRMVSPQTPVGVVIRRYVFGVLGVFVALLVIAAVVTHVTNWTGVIAVALFASVVAFAAFRRRPNENYCPICKSRALEARPAN